MIFVGVCEYDATQIGNEETSFAQSRAECLDRFFCLRSGVDDRQRIFGNEVDVYRTNIKRCRQ